LAVGTQAAAGELIVDFTELVEFTEGNLPASNKGEEMRYKVYFRSKLEFLNVQLLQQGSR